VEEEKMSLELLLKVWIRHSSMRIETVEIKKEISEVFGYKE
jgi:hypothetical protein